MKNLRKITMLLIVLFATVVIAISCGGGGGGGGESTGSGTGGGTGGGTAQQGSAGAAAMYILKNAINIAFNLYDFSSSPTGETQSKQITSLNLPDILKGEGISISQAPFSCEGGGTIDVQLTSDGEILTYNNCVTLDTPSGKTMTLDGTVTVTGDVLSGNAEFIFDLTVTEKRISDQMVLSRNEVNLTYSLTDMSFSTCGGDSAPVAMTMMMNGTVSSEIDEDGDGTTDKDFTTTYNDYILNITLDYDSSCEVISMSITQTGSVQMVDNITSQTFNISISSSDPMVTQVTYPGNNTSSATISGTFTITSPCFNGTVTITTTTPLIYGYQEDCPSAGVVVFSGAIEATYTFSSSGYTVDLNNDGSIDETHSDCSTAYTMVCS